MNLRHAAPLLFDSIRATSVLKRGGLYISVENERSGPSPRRSSPSSGAPEKL
jgi:hypothetical protein